MPNERWTVLAVLRAADDFLKRKGVEKAKLDSEVLLAYTLGIDRIGLFVQFERLLSETERARYRELLRRRAAFEPVAYITGRREFMSLDFTVTPDVLVPRPETELVAEAAIRTAKEEYGGGALLADIGTGSGCIAAALAHYLPESKVVAADISPAACEVARGNFEKLNVTGRIDLRTGDLFEPLGDLKGRFDIIVSNPPYVAESEREILPTDVRDFEPEVALFTPGGEQLEIVGRLIAGSPEYLSPRGYLILELGYDIKPGVERLVSESAAFDGVRFERDYADIDRVAIMRLK